MSEKVDPVILEVANMLRDTKFHLASLKITTTPGSYQGALLELATKGISGNLEWCISELMRVAEEGDSSE
jgi:hypothetical protein